MRAAFLISAIVLVGAGMAMAGLNPFQQQNEQRPTAPTEGESIVVAGGCFWCVEPLFEMLKGVKEVEVGYAGGHRPNVTYEQVMTGVTGHAEAVKVFFDPEVISADDLLRIFLLIHDPTTLNRQGPDSGPQYRSAIFFANDEEKARAQRIIAEIEKEKVWDRPIVTTLEPLKNYTRAEEYHQDYYKKFETASNLERMRMNVGYCRVVIAPKVTKFRERFKHLLKD
jgi:peptide-methionine (S)-S-oxide reductase